MSSLPDLAALMAISWSKALLKWVANEPFSGNSQCQGSIYQPFWGGGLFIFTSVLNLHLLPLIQKAQRTLLNPDVHSPPKKRPYSPLSCYLRSPRKHRQALLLIWFTSTLVWKIRNNIELRVFSNSLAHCSSILSPLTSPNQRDSNRPCFSYSSTDLIL